jgi:plastocyanin
MKLRSLIYLFSIVLIIGFYACNKNTGFEQAGGLLPTNYIVIKDSTFSPVTLTVANGSSITFLNQTTVAHTIMSDDTTTLRAALIRPDSSFYFKPDTATSIPVPIYIPYHCIEHPSSRGVIVLNQ